MEKKWYVLHIRTGFEEKVRTEIEKIKQTPEGENNFFSILIPQEEVVEIKKNRKRIRKRPFFPGYLLIEMIMDDETHWLIRNISGVSGFLGGLNPVPLSEEESASLLNLSTVSEGTKPRPSILFEKGESIRIIDGPFRHFIGVVGEVNEERAKLKVMVTIFGRPTPVELDFLQVEKT